VFLGGLAGDVDLQAGLRSGGHSEERGLGREGQGEGEGEGEGLFHGSGAGEGPVPSGWWTAQFSY